MKKSTHLIVFMILAIILAFLVGLYGYFLWKVNDYPKKTDILKTDTFSKNNLLKNADPKTSEMKIEEQQNDLAKLEGILIKEGEEFNLIKKIEDVCSRSSVTCNINPLAVDINTDLPSEFHILNMQIDAIGSFADSFQFINAMENLPYSSSISKATLEFGGNAVGLPSPSEPKAKSSWRVSLNLKVTTIK